MFRDTAANLELLKYHGGISIQPILVRAVNRSYRISSGVSVFAFFICVSLNKKPLCHLVENLC